MPYDDVPTGGAGHTQVHRDIATALDGVASANPVGASAGQVLTANGAGSATWTSVLVGADGAVGVAGASVTITGGYGNDGDNLGASFTVEGGGATGSVTDGRVRILTGDSNGTDGQVLTAQGDGTALWEDAGGGGGGTPGVDYPTPATVTLSSAQLLDLHNTPITLVAAPGAGKYLHVHRIIASYAYGTTTYATGDGLFLVYGADVFGVEDANFLTNIITAAGSRYGASAVEFTATNHGPSDLANLPLNASAFGTPITTGDGTLTVTVWYSIEDVP